MHACRSPAPAHKQAAADFKLGTSVVPDKDIVLIVGEGGSFVNKVAQITASAGEVMIADGGSKTVLGMQGGVGRSENDALLRESARITQALTTVSFELNTIIGFFFDLKGGRGGGEHRKQCAS